MSWVLSPDTEKKLLQAKSELAKLDNMNFPTTTVKAYGGVKTLLDEFDKISENAKVYNECIRTTEAKLNQQIKDSWKITFNDKEKAQIMEVISLRSKACLKIQSNYHAALKRALVKCIAHIKSNMPKQEALILSEHAFDDIKNKYTFIESDNMDYNTI